VCGEWMDDRYGMLGESDGERMTTGGMDGCRMRGVSTLRASSFHVIF
jgi:hypothetical protein